MRKICLFSTFILAAGLAQAQFSTDKLQLTAGYNVHNAHAKRFNHLVDAFNEDRYPFVVERNLPNIHWLRGFCFGANYAFNEDIRLHAVLKTRRQFIEAKYAGMLEYRQYLFRQHTLELGADLLMSEEGRFSHYIGGGVMFGVLGVFSDWTHSQGFHGSRRMVNIDHTGVLGLSVNYEVQFKLHDNFRIFLRPVAQYALHSHVRKLTDFFAPTPSDGGIIYGDGEPEKYDSGTLNGLGIEGGLLILLPEL